MSGADWLTKEMLADWHKEIVCDLRELIEAVRALKPASDPIPSELELQDKLQRAEHLVEMWRGVARAKEVERLQKKVADQALTIATLKDELAQTKHLLSEERALTAATASTVCLGTVLPY